MRLIDFLLSTYGLISGDVSEVASDLASDKMESSIKFEISKEVGAFIDAITFLSPLQETASKHVLFQHSPGWTIILSNSSELGNFSKYQKAISKNLKRPSIQVVDIEETMAVVKGKNYNKTLNFIMLDENGELVRSISSVLQDGKIKFEDLGKGFAEYKFDTKDKQKEFSPSTLSELIQKATKYDESLDQGLKNQFFLLEEK